MINISKEKPMNEQRYSFLSNFSKQKIKILEDDRGDSFIFIVSKNQLIKIKDSSEIDELLLNLCLNEDKGELPEISSKKNDNVDVDFFGDDKEKKYKLLFKEKDIELKEKTKKAYKGYIRPLLGIFVNNFNFADGRKITRDVAAEYIKLAMNNTIAQQKKMDRPLPEYSNPEESVKDEILNEFAALMEQLQNPVSNFQICELKDLEYNGKEHLSIEEAANKLMESYTKTDIETGETLLDISELPEEIQIILMKNFYDKKIDITQDEKSAIRDYQSIEYDAFKALLNASSDKYLNTYLQYLMSDKIERMTVDRTVKDIYTMIDIFEKLPNRKMDLLISRVGSETINDDRSVEHSDFTSFGTNLGTNTMDDENVNLYKMVLKKDVPAIPIIFLIDRSDRIVYDECEILLPPALYIAKEGSEYTKLEIESLKINEVTNTLMTQLSRMEAKVNEMMARDENKNDRLKKILETIERSKEYITSREMHIQVVDERIESKDVFAQEPVLSKQSLAPIAKETPVVFEQETAATIIEKLGIQNQIDKGEEKE